MSKEYIERETALEKVIEVKHSDPELSGVVLHRYIKEIDLKDIPAAEVAPVVHGRWINFYNDFTVAECDQCASQFEVTFDGEANGALWNGFKQFYKYCPNCGAKMDKEEVCKENTKNT